MSMVSSEPSVTASEESILSGELDERQFRPRASRTMLIGATVIALVLLVAVALTWGGISAKEEQLRQDTERRLSILLDGRLEVIQTWLDGVVALSDRVTQADLFRLFAAETDMSLDGGEAGGSAEGESLQQSLFEQAPLMTAILQEFAQNTGFRSARLIDRRGDVYVSTEGVQSLQAGHRALAEKVFAEGRPVLGPVAATSEGMVLDFLLPLYPPEGADDKVVSVLHLSRVVTDKVAEFRTAPPMARSHEVFRVFQVGAAGLEELQPGAVPPVQSVGASDFEARDLTFGERTAVGGDREVFSRGRMVPGLGWIMVAEANAQAVRAELESFTQTAVGIAGLIVLVVMTAFGAFWWRLVGDHNRTMAEQFRALAARIHSQRQLLDSINNTITDWIGLKDKSGAYVYANPALAAAVNRPVDKVVGLDDAALFGHGTAERLNVSDQHVLSTGRPTTSDEKIYLSSKLHYLHVAKMPVFDQDGAMTGIVSVSRDVTELVIQQEKREKAVKQMVVALVRAIELRDPYLGGHSRRVAAFAVAVGKRLDLPPDRLATVEIAANLSQIGKLSISRAILNKPGRLTPEEQTIVQGHVDHAAAVLKGIDFELPVFETVCQMSERLDGGGYPHGLKGEEISIEGRILSALDVFCARIAPRSYRPAISPAEALGILKDNTTRYDEAVVAALGAVLDSPEGDRILQDIKAEAAL